MCTCEYIQFLLGFPRVCSTDVLVVIKPSMSQLIYKFR